MHVIVVGGGLIGSAAAKYLAEHDRTVVTVFAPPEPADASTSSGPFASHYDQGRVTRIADVDPFWADAARRSIERYRDIEARSGIGFYRGRPLVFMTPRPDEVVAVARRHGAQVEAVGSDWLVRHTSIRVPDGYEGGIVYEHAPAGFIDPRRLVRAQLKLAIAAGATVVDTPVVRLDVAGSGVTAVAADGTVVGGDRVLLTTGAYGAGLAGIDVPLERRLRTVALIEVGGVDPERLPTLIVHDLDRPGLEEVYWVPPVRYPDGGTYLKIGGDAVPVRLAGDDDPSADIAAWFRQSGDAGEAAELVRVAAELLPDADLRPAGHLPCVVTVTPSGRPVIERFDDHIAVAVGGNGAAAKSSDALGHDAAALVLSS